MTKLKRILGKYFLNYCVNASLKRISHKIYLIRTQYKSVTIAWETGVSLFQHRANVYYHPIRAPLDATVETKWTAH